MNISEKVKFVDAEIAEQKSSIRELKIFKKETASDDTRAYFDKLIAAARKQLVTLRARKREFIDAGTRAKRHDLVLRIAERLHMSLRDHLPPNFSAERIICAAEAVEKFVIRAGSIKAANALHDKEGGSRGKADKLRAIWASGRYRTKEECAQKGGASLGMSFKAAKKALQNAPKPNVKK